MIHGFMNSEKEVSIYINSNWVRHLCSTADVHCNNVEDVVQYLKSGRVKKSRSHDWCRNQHSEWNSRLQVWFIFVHIIVSQNREGNFHGKVLVVASHLATSMTSHDNLWFQETGNRVYKVSLFPFVDTDYTKDVQLITGK